MNPSPSDSSTDAGLAFPPRRQFLRHLSLGTLAGLLAADTRSPAGAAELTAPAAGAPLAPFAVLPTAPLEPGPGGLDIRVLVRHAQTGGQFSCVETAVGAHKMGPAPHVHHDLDELMYVLEGSATVWMDGKVEEIPAGGWHLRPRGIPHTFWNGGAGRLRFIDMYFHQPFEDFLEELFHDILPAMVKAHLTPADPVIARRLDALNQRFGVVTYPEKRQPLIKAYNLVD